MLSQPYLKRMGGWIGEITLIRGRTDKTRNLKKMPNFILFCWNHLMYCLIDLNKIFFFKFLKKIKKNWPLCRPRQ